jgi:hypothetical protein
MHCSLFYRIIISSEIEYTGTAFPITEEIAAMDYGSLRALELYKTS